MMLDRSKKTLIPFFMAGYPTMEACERFIEIAVEEGIQVIELGVPFSDPLADGPTIQQAAMVALQQGTSLADVLELARRVRSRFPKLSIIVFTYLNPILKFGIEKYIAAAIDAGIAATLTVDLPPEEAEMYLRMHRAAGLQTVFLASPTTNPGRVPTIAEASSGFIYFVSRAGVTGAQRQISETLADEIGAFRKISDRFDRAVAVGFGVSSSAQVREIAKYADAVVVGSHLLNLMTEDQESNGRELKFRPFLRECLSVLKEFQ